MFPVNNNYNNNKKNYNNNDHNNHNKFSTYVAHSKTCPNGFYNKEKILKILNSRSSSGLFITKDVVVSCT